MRNSIYLGTFFGIEIRADLSWFVILVLVIWMLNGHYATDGNITGVTLIMAIGTGVLFFASIVAHELGHSLVSNRLGLPVPRITLFIFGGIAQLSREPERPRDEFVIAVAGPLVSFMLALGFGALAWAGTVMIRPLLIMAGQWLGMINLVLALFNLLPAFPLDGGRILRAVIWGITRNYKAATLIVGGTGKLIAFGIIFWGSWLILQGDWANGLWIVLVGWFIQHVATQSLQQLTLKSSLAGHTVREAMMVDCPRVSPTVTIQKLVEEIMPFSGRRCFPIVGGMWVTGLITLNEIRNVPHEQWATTTVGMVMIPVKELKSVSPESGLFEALERLSQASVNQLPVIENDQVVGMIARDNILAFSKSARS